MILSHILSFKGTITPLFSSALYCMGGCKKKKILNRKERY